MTGLPARSGSPERGGSDVTVAELIEQLQQMPQDAPVHVYSPWAGEKMPAEKVEHQPAVPKLYVEEYVWIE
jgi:hypothetical protein